MNSKSKPAAQNQQMWEWYKQLLEFRKRGIADGWLQIENWSTTVANKDCFSHVYQAEDRRIEICCRLAKADSDPVVLDFTAEVEKLFDSRGNALMNTSRIELLDQHCCIWSSK